MAVPTLLSRANPIINHITYVMNRAEIRRYTDLPSLIDILAHQRITLLDPKSWDDRNDSFYISKYKEKKKLKSVLALCFTSTNETYHHWRVFSGNVSGVCIVFNKDALLESVKRIPGIRYQQVEYLTLNAIKKIRLKTANLPFIKRSAFRHDEEYRIIYESATKEVPTFDLNILLTCIERIVLSPWMPKALSDSTKNLLRKIDGCLKIKITRSTLINNEQWKKIGETNIK